MWCNVLIIFLVDFADDKIKIKINVKHLKDSLKTGDDSVLFIFLV